MMSYTRRTIPGILALWTWRKETDCKICYSKTVVIKQNQLDDI